MALRADSGSMDDYSASFAPNSVHGLNIDARNRPGTPYWCKATEDLCRYRVHGRIRLESGRCSSFCRRDELDLLISPLREGRVELLIPAPANQATFHQFHLAPLVEALTKKRVFCPSEKPEGSIIEHGKGGWPVPTPLHWIHCRSLTRLMDIRAIKVIGKLDRTGNRRRLRCPPRSDAACRETTRDGLP